MTESRFDPRRVDIRSFAATAAHREDDTPVSDFLRLNESTLQLPGDVPPATVHWAADGEERQSVGGAPEIWLHLHAQTDVTLECQRCLQPYRQPLMPERWFRFASDEDEAARLDEESEDDVLVLTRWVDLLELIEDELILSLPLVPRHDECPQPLTVPDETAPDETPAAHPFAALANWRRKGEGNAGE